MTASDRTTLEAAAEAAYPVDDDLDWPELREAYVKGAESRQPEIDVMASQRDVACAERDALRARIDGAETP